MRSIGLLAVVTGTVFLASSCGEGSDLTPPENAAPVANFELPACTIDESCEFVSTSTDDAGVTGWNWDFNGDNTSDANTATAAYTYRTAGTFDASLTAFDAEGLSHRKTSRITIDPAPVNTPPTAGFTYSCNGPNCTFTNTSSDAAPGTIATYAWTFGDNATSDQASPTHTYAVTGPTEFTVTLTVTDNDGATDAETQTITVTPAAPVNPPSAGFTYTCTLLVCNFVSTSTDVAPGTIVGYAWTFGDGGTAAVKKPSHTYSVSERTVFTVTLTVTDNDGGTAVATRTVTVDAVPPLNTPPTASFSYACAAAACTFISTATDAEGPIATFAWTFGDGADAVGNNPAHTYTISATTEFTVTLTVTDNGGATAVASQTITVNPDASANIPPTASFHPWCYGEGCVFINNSTDAAPGAIVSYVWTYGDGGTSSRNTPCFPWTELCGVGRRVYSITGPTTFTVTLTVTDNLGAVAVATRTITVRPLPPAVQGCSTSGKIVECVLDIPTRSSLVLTVLGVSCDLGGQSVNAPPPVAAVLFLNVCNATVVGASTGIFASNDEGRYLFEAGTQARIWFHQSDRALNPAGGRLEGTFPNWTLSYEDGDQPDAPGEADFADFVLGVQATPR
jgi:PKD repeat protein